MTSQHAIGRVLIIEDNDDHRLALRKAIEPAGYEIIEAADGETGLASALDPVNEPDVVLLDLELPVLDGYEVCAQLKANANTTRIPVIIITGVGTSPESMRRGLESGANDYLLKPVDIDGVRLRVRNAVRTKRLYVELVESLQDLREAEKEKDKLRQRIVHDLQNPLAAIHGSAELLLREDIGEDPALRMEFIQMIKVKCESLLQDIGDILKPIDVNWSPKCEDFDLAAMLELEVKAERHTSRAASHLISLTGTGTPFIINADKRKIRRVVENLLSNAVKYSPGSNKRVSVDLSSQRDCVRVSYTDEGIGLTDEQISKVLCGGGRVVDPALGIEGTGFGIDSCLRILKAHGGALEISSEYGEGSTFSMVLPCNSVATR